MEESPRGTASTASLCSDRFGFKPKRVKLFTLSLRFSQVGAILSAGLLDKDAKTAYNSSKIAVDNNTIYTYNGKVVATDKVNNGKVVALTKKEYLSWLSKQDLYSVLYGDPDEIAIVPQEDLSKYASVYNLYNKKDFNTLMKTTDMKYNNINSKADIVFVNGMNNTLTQAQKSQKLIQDDFPNSNVGLINNQTGMVPIVSDIAEWLPNYLTTKDVLTAHQLQQLPANAIVIGHSAGNEDIFKANQINTLLNAKTPYYYYSEGSPKSATDLKSSLNSVGATFVRQDSHPNDPVTIFNSDANYEYKSIINTYYDLINNHPFSNYYYDYKVKEEIQKVKNND